MLLRQLPRLGLALLLPCAVLVSRAAAADTDKDLALKAAAALYEGIRVEKLDNGLAVYLKPVAGSPTVTVMTAYKVGSSDEDLTATGLSHYLEHLMFKGTDKIKPGDIDRLTLRNGGANNAYTSEDYTIFHFDFDRERWPVALDIEADRMQNLRIDKAHEFQQEKGAVINELLRDEDRALGPGAEGHPAAAVRQERPLRPSGHRRARAGRGRHGRHHQIALRQVVSPQQCLAGDCRRHRPGQGAEGRSRPALPPSHRPSSPRKSEPKELPKRPARLEMVSKFEAARLLMGFTSVANGSPDDAVLDVVQGLLSGGRTGRLYRKLVEGDEVGSQCQRVQQQPAARPAGSASRSRCYPARTGPPWKRPSWPS